MRKIWKGILMGAVAAAVALVFAPTASAQNKCLAGKTKCVNKKVAGLLKCQEKCQKDPLKCGGVETTCQDKVIAKFNGVSDPESCFGKLEAKNDGPCVTFSDRSALEAKVDTFVVDVRGELENWPPPTPTPTVTPTPMRTDTPIPCPTSTPPPRFVDNGDGTVTDNQTGLQWEKKTDDGGDHDKDNFYMWTDPDYADCANQDGTAQFLAMLNTTPCFAGHCDWRLPKVNRDGDPAELETILLEPYPCGTSPCIDPVFGPTVAGWYWSATSAAGCPNIRCFIGFESGEFDVIGEWNSLFVRAVRGGVLPAPAPTPTPRFVDNGDGTVTDNQTGLQWEKKTDDGGVHDKDNQYTWDDPSDGDYTNPDGTAFTGFLATVNGGATGVGNCVDNDTYPPYVTGGFAGHCDWRLPMIDELSTIINRDSCDVCRTHPCIDPIFGPTIAGLYWSATTLSWAPTVAWLVEFGDGWVDSGTGLKGAYDLYVRAVRAGS